MSRVEAFVTEIKTVLKALLGGRSRNQCDLQTTENQQSRKRGYNLTFDPWKSSNQEPQKGTIK